MEALSLESTFKVLHYAGRIMGVRDFSTLVIWKMIVAEFLGTFLLVTFGCGTMIYINKEELVVQIALAFGTVLAGMVYAFGHISGCHVNPAVTLSFLIVGKCPVLRTLIFIPVQLFGATMAMYCLLQATPARTRINNVGNTILFNSLSARQGFVLEAFGTFAFVLVIHSVANDKTVTRGSSSIIVGLALVACHLFLINFTGCSVNPARSFGPSYVYKKWENHWIYWYGPIIGALCAAIVHFVISVPYLERHPDRKAETVSQEEDIEKK